MSWRAHAKTSKQTKGSIPPSTRKTKSTKQTKQNKNQPFSIYSRGAYRSQKKACFSTLFHPTERLTDHPSRRHFIIPANGAFQQALQKRDTSLPYLCRVVILRTTNTSHTTPGPASRKGRRLTPDVFSFGYDDTVAILVLPHSHSLQLYYSPLHLLPQQQPQPPLSPPPSRSPLP